MSHITLQRNGTTKQAKLGFSWTVFFLGIFVPISRAMWPQVLITFLTCGLANFYYMFKLNSLYVQKLREEGWKEHDQSQYEGA